jgi:hypothetical protein
VGQSVIVGFLPEVREFVAREVVDVVVILGFVDPRTEIVPKSLAEAVVVRVAVAAM